MILSSRMPRQSAAARTGAAVVELAMVAPIFLLFVFLLIEFGRMILVQQAITNAAREGCRQASLAATQDASQVEASVRGYLTACLPQAGNASVCRITVTPASLTNLASNTEITTTVEVDYADATWMPTRFLGSTVLSGTARMKRE